MITQRRPVVISGAIVAVLLLALIIGMIAALSGGSRHHPRPAAGPPATTAGPLSAEQTGFTPVPPLTDAPAQTPVQEQYDSAFASGLASSSSVEIAEQTQVPAPAYSPSWPSIPVANNPDSWASEFTQGLLDIDFAHQSRADLGAWLSAEEAPELLPGVPQSVQDKVLYLSTFDATAVGSGQSPIPDQATWDSLARSGERWIVSDLLVQPDPTFSRIVASGWQAVDQRFGVEDVSGLLSTATGGSHSQRHFTMTVYVGSAHWHPGYGTVLIDNWKES